MMGPGFGTLGTMRLDAAIITAWLLFAGSIAAAQAMSQRDCEIIERLDQFQIVQTRLAGGADMAFYVNDIRFLRSQIDKIDKTDLLAAVGETSRSAAGRAVVTLFDQTRDLLDNARLANPATARAHYRDPAVQATLRLIRDQMRRWRCPVEGIITMEPWMYQTNSGDTVGGNAAEPVEFTFDLSINKTTVLTVIGGIATAAAAFRIYRTLLLRSRRRAKRYSANFQTVYRVGDRDLPGALLDISGNGTKLRFDPAHPLPKSAQVEVLIFDDWVQGTSVWSNAHYSGIVFRSAITNATVRNIRKTDRNPTTKAA